MRCKSRRRIICVDRYQRVGGERRLGDLPKGDLACIRHAPSATLRWPLSAYEFNVIMLRTVPSFERSEDDETKMIL
jgi:hypothetical protein